MYFILCETFGLTPFACAAPSARAGGPRDPRPGWRPARVSPWGRTAGGPPGRDGPLPPLRRDANVDMAAYGGEGENLKEVGAQDNYGHSTACRMADCA
jgi:hypothetical protein